MVRDELPHEQHYLIGAGWQQCYNIVQGSEKKSGVLSVDIEPTSQSQIKIGVEATT